MSQGHTPNVPSRGTTFLIGILKLCFMVSKKKESSSIEFSAEDELKSSSTVKKIINSVRSTNSTDRTNSIH